jgi:uncharacterized protein (DUF111 family)
MKKTRPGLIFGAVAPLDRERDCASAMLAQTTTLGVRVRHDHRYIIERRIEEVETPFGRVRVKSATVGGFERQTLEYDDLARIARERGIPIAEVARAVGNIVFRS